MVVDAGQGARADMPRVRGMSLAEDEIHLHRPGQGPDQPAAREPAVRVRAAELALRGCGRPDRFRATAWPVHSPPGGRRGRPTPSGHSQSLDAPLVRNTKARWVRL